MAPSAEFQKYRRRSIPLADVEGRSAVEAAAVEGRMSRMDRQSTLYAYHDNAGAKLEGHNNGSPPPFAPGLFKDPIFEKGLAIGLGIMADMSDRIILMETCFDRWRTSFVGRDYLFPVSLNMYGPGQMEK